MKFSIALATILLVAANFCVAAPAAVTVVSVTDGDTIVVGGGTRVRLASIDAPEVSHGYGKPSQPFGQAAKVALIQLLAGGRVSIDCVDTDRYGRAVCNVYQGQVNVNRALVQQGLAWANTSRPSYLRDGEMLALQIQARQANRGLWSEPNPVAPWAWRRQK